MNKTGHDEEMEVHLRRIAQEVFLLMTDIELEPSADTVEPTAAVISRLCYQSPVGMELELICERSLAFVATQRLMSLKDLPCHVDEMVQDSVDEIVNMVGGNFHSILSPGMALDTTPRAVSGITDGRSVRFDMCLGAAQGAVRLRLTEGMQ